MMKILIPLILLLIGLGGGVGAGLMLKPESKELEQTDEHAQVDCPANPLTDQDKISDMPAEQTGENAPEYIAFASQFIVPVVIDGEVKNIMVLGMSMQMSNGRTKDFERVEPKLRDSFLQVLFSHANTGGFNDHFTSNSNMRILKKELLKSAQSVLGSSAEDVLILDIIRQKA